MVWFIDSLVIGDYLGFGTCDLRFATEVIYAQEYSGGI